jgi:hypothetical protein
VAAENTRLGGSYWLFGQKKREAPAQRRVVKPAGAYGGNRFIFLLSVQETLAAAAILPIFSKKAKTSAFFLCLPTVFPGSIASLGAKKKPLLEGGPKSRRGLLKEGCTL